jgi:sulfopyruvate decarboxylase subunit beta
MNEEIVLRILHEEHIDLIASLPCDKNKRLTYLLPSEFPVLDLTREEDGVGICAGAVLAGKRPVMSIQSSGLGNMLNALLSLSCVYHFPLPILASWRGVWNEAICAQIPFNKPLPEILDVYHIPYMIFRTDKDLEGIRDVIHRAFEQQTPYVALILPSCWEPQQHVEITYPVRSIPEKIISLPSCVSPKLTRLEAISTIVSLIPENAVIISNIGVPSKELFAAKDRAGNFYMLGSYMQASAIGLGCAFCSPATPVYVIDGDGSLLGSAVLPVIAAQHLSNLHIMALDNGTFGSTGNQMSPAYATADLGMLALAVGITSVLRVSSHEGIADAISRRVPFVHILIRPMNSTSPNISMTPGDIRRRVESFLQKQGREK